MKVFSKLFVGVRDGGAAHVPLGFATPYEENAAGRKRQETVVNWLGGTSRIVVDPKTGLYEQDDKGRYVYEEFVPDTRIIDNEPCPGFKITDDVKRVYWGGGNVVWRVEDPRGYELEIQSQNLMALIQSCGILEGGEIPGRCVWGRSSGDNILLHETSDEYKAAFKAAETLKAPKKLGKKDRRVGGLYTRVDGSLGIYLGIVHVTVMNYPAQDGALALARNWDASETDWFKAPGMLQPVAVSTSNYPVMSSVEYEAVLDITSVLDDKDRPTPGVTMKLYKQAPLVADEGETYDLAITNEYLRDLQWTFASSNTFCARILAVTTSPIKNPLVVAVPWAATKYDAKLTQLERYVAQNCTREITYKDEGTFRARWPATQILGYQHTDVLIVPELGPMSDIEHIGEDRQYITRGVAAAPDSLTVALPCMLGAGYFIHRGAEDSRHAMQVRSYMYSRYSYPASREVKAYVLPKFSTADEFIDWFKAQYNDGNLSTISVVEDSRST
jgi:hypothetical protein